MPELPPLLLAGLTGLVSGLLLSFPPGPINLTILNEGARRGFKWAALIGLGATVMEVIYCFIAFTSFGSFFTRSYVKPAMQLFGFFFMSFIGVKFLLAKSVPSRRARLGAMRDRIEARLEKRLQPHSAFMTGIVRVMGNVGVLVFWVLLALYFIAHDLVAPDWPGKLACLAGVTIGTGAWYTGLSWVVSFGRGKLSEKSLLRMERYSGACLLILALIEGGIMIGQMHSKH